MLQSSDERCPDRLLLPKLSILRFWIWLREETFPSDEGMLPERSLFERSRNSRVDILWKSGILPVKMLNERSTILRDLLVPKDLGMLPISMFSDSIKVWRAGNLWKSGIVPTRWFSVRLTCMRDLLVPRDLGMIPSRMFTERIINCSCRSVPNSSGMLPEKRFSERSSRSSDVRLAIQGDN